MATSTLEETGIGAVGGAVGVVLYEFGLLVSCMFGLQEVALPRGALLSPPALVSELRRHGYMSICIPPPNGQLW